MRKAVSLAPRRATSLPARPASSRLRAPHLTFMLWLCALLPAARVVVFAVVA